MPLSEELAYEVLDRSPMPCLVVDDGGCFVHGNPAACALLGRPREALLGLRIADVAAPDIDVEEAWLRFEETGSQQGEFRLARPDGGVVTVQFNADREFLPGRHIGVLTDISDRKRIETQLRRNEELYIRAFNGSPAPTNVRRLDKGTFVEVNEAFTQATGFWRADVVGRSGRVLGLWLDPALLESLLDRLRGGEEKVTTRATLSTKDRQLKEFSVAMKRVEIFAEPHVVAVYSDMASL